MLARDDDALRRAIAAGAPAERLTPGITPWVEVARHRLQLLEGRPSTVDVDLRAGHSDWPLSTDTLWLLGREAIDSGAADQAVAGVRALALIDTPHYGPRRQAVVAAVEAAASGDENRWHEALLIAADKGFRLIAVDALEGLAAAAARAESWAETLRLLAAAQRLRDETGYRWRFGFEETSVNEARATALSALGHDVEAVIAQGLDLDWSDAASYARRARGERKRPHHGWASLTPTELQVAALVTQGDTNAQIAERLLMGRATVKTHLDHIFTKLDVHSRTELAAMIARRTPT